MTNNLKNVTSTLFQGWDLLHLHLQWKGRVSISFRPIVLLLVGMMNNGSIEPLSIIMSFETLFSIIQLL